MTNTKTATNVAYGLCIVAAIGGALLATGKWKFAEPLALGIGPQSAGCSRSSPGWLRSAKRTTPHTTLRSGWLRGLPR